jgi:hypothetical protein
MVKDRAFVTPFINTRFKVQFLIESICRGASREAARAPQGERK